MIEVSGTEVSFTARHLRSLHRSKGELEPVLPPWALRLRAGHCKVCPNCVLDSRVHFAAYGTSRSHRTPCPRVLAAQACNRVAYETSNPGALTAFEHRGRNVASINRAPHRVPVSISAAGLIAATYSILREFNALRRRNSLCWRVEEGVHVAY